MKREVTFSGTVVKGENTGKKLGFPTVNIDRKGFSNLSQKPKLGIYAGFVVFPNGKEKKASFVIGPNDKKGLPKLEAYILNFSEDLYGEKVRFVLKKFLRAFKKYSNKKDLIKQIKVDVEKTRGFLS